MAVFSIELDAREWHSDEQCLVTAAAAHNEEIIFEMKHGPEMLAGFALSVKEAEQLRDFLNFVLK